ncbi:MAG: hypothetical protein NUV81_00590, partial [bacterium]|nr:hypothetical protein [bacterium]
MIKKIKKRFSKKRNVSTGANNFKDEKKEDDIEKSLTAIYQDESGEMPDLSRINPARSRWWTITLITSLLFIVSVVGVSALYVTLTKPFRGFSGDALQISIEGPENVSVGKETTYIIHYKNQTSEPLAQTELRITFPSDFIVEAREPMPTEGESTWRLGSLHIGAEGTVEVRGTFMGALGTTSAIQVVGTYRPASFNSDFETLVTAVLVYSESVLEGELRVPEKVLPGDRVLMAYFVQNNGDKELENLVSRIELPVGFTVESATGKTDLVNEVIDNRMLEFEIGNLGAGSSTEVEVVGSFSTNISGDILVNAETGR